MSEIERAIVAALDVREDALNACPARRRSLGDVECPKCGATTRGPCWENVAADAAFVDAIKELVA
jgi:ribosomal protein L37AE/L43A